MRILSVNVGKLQRIPGAKSKSLTGIYKMPVRTAVVDADGLIGDHIGSVKYHGGPDQAVYIYSAEDYAWWEETLQRDLVPGIFGENLTVSTLGARPPRLGDIWHIEGVTLQLSAPRIPCSTLAARIGEPKFVKMFAQANRGGAYARVLTSGELRAGLPVTVEPAASRNPTIDELFAEWHKRHNDLDLLQRALAGPLASLARVQVEKWVSQWSSPA